MLRDKEFLKDIKPHMIVGGAMEVKFRDDSGIMREAINLRNHTLLAARLACQGEACL